MPGPASGIPVNFGFTGANGITITGLSGLLLQSADYSAEADKDEVRQGQGDIVSRNWYDVHYKSSFECVITGTGIAASIAATTLAGVTPGTVLTITQCLSMPELTTFNGGKWEVVSSATIKASNVTCKRISIPVEARPTITGQQAP